MTTIVFSKDRAMQLHAFLRSYRDHVTPVTSIDVLYQATSTRHEQAYAAVFKEMPFAWPVPQSSFRYDVLDLLPPSGNVVFFVDDQIFVRPWSVQERHGLSLRLAPHLSRCYPLNIEQAVPSFEHEDDLLLWRWSDGQHDWGYPLSLDGHVFDLAEVRPWIASLHFDSPNMLEAALQQFTSKFATRRGACYSKSTVVNTPWNRVQTDYENRNAASVTVEEMLAFWEDGKKIDTHALYGVLNESAHQEFPLVLEDRHAS